MFGWYRKMKAAKAARKEAQRKAFEAFCVSLIKLSGADPDPTQHLRLQLDLADAYRPGWREARY